MFLFELFFVLIFDFRGLVVGWVGVMGARMWDCQSKSVSSFHISSTVG